MWSAGWSRDGWRMLSGSYDETARQWDMENGGAILAPTKTGHRGVSSRLLVRHDQVCDCWIRPALEKDTQVGYLAWLGPMMEKQIAQPDVVEGGRGAGGTYTERYLTCIDPVLKVSACLHTVYMVFSYPLSDT